MQIIRTSENWWSIFLIRLCWRLIFLIYEYLSKYIQSPNTNEIYFYIYKRFKNFLRLCCWLREWYQLVEPLWGLVRQYKNRFLVFSSYQICLLEKLASGQFYVDTQHQSQKKQHYWKITKLICATFEFLLDISIGGVAGHFYTRSVVPSVQICFWCGAGVS